MRVHGGRVVVACDAADGAAPEVCVVELVRAQRFSAVAVPGPGLFHADRILVVASRRPVRQTTATSRTAVPERTPRTPTATAAASACAVPMPAAISAAAPAPTWVAAPAGPIGKAAAAAPAQRKSSAC